MTTHGEMAEQAHAYLRHIAVDDGTHQAAVRRVCRYARNPQDARRLLDILGLTGVARGRPVVPASAPKSPDLAAPLTETGAVA